MNPLRSAGRQRGALALVLAMGLFVAMALTLVFSHRNLLVEQRNAAQHERSVQAFAAAEAGLDWAVAQLNANRRIGADCLTSADPAASSFRSRYLRIDAGTGAIGVAPGMTAPPACAQQSGGWVCRCPAAGVVAPTAAFGIAPGFSIDLTAAAGSGTIRLVSTGCSDIAAGACTPGAAGAAASARVEATLGLLPAISAPPAAAVTLGGNFDAGGAAVDLRNADPASGGLVDAGGAILAPLARLTVPPGGVVGEALVDHDPALAGLASGRFFTTFFGMPSAAWSRTQSALPIVCPADCGDTLASELAAAADSAVIRVDGDLAIGGPRTFGTPERPLLLVVSGQARFDGAVGIHGVVQAGSLRWHGAGGFVRGALLVGADYQGDAGLILIRDAAVLDRLHRATGPLVRVNGSWHDF